MIESRNDLGWNCIDFEAVDCGGPTQRLFDASARQGAGKVLLRDAVPSCYIELPTSWEAFLMVLSKNHRKRCRRWCREYFDTGRVACFSTDAGWHPDVAFEVLVMLHNERRAGLGGGAFDDPRFERFLRNALTRLAARGMAEVRAIQMNGRFLAVECVLVGTRAIHAYQSGLAGAGLEHNAGALSTIAMVQSAIDRGMQRLDLMRGTEAYKFHWGARVQPMQRIGWWPPTVGGRLAHSTNLLWDLSKTMVQAVASASPSE